MRAIRVLYVENDPALRSLLGSMMNSSPSLEVVGEFGLAGEAIKNQQDLKADVALIDFSLEQNGLNGIELGIALRATNENLGIVIYSQFSVGSMVKRVPEKMRHGWSFFDKSAAMKIEDYEQVLTSTAEGRGNWLQILEAATVSDRKASSLFLSLSPRQRMIMSLKARGLNAKEISNELGISYTYVRQEISRAYTVLVPNPAQTSDIKALALMKYLEITKSE